MDVLHESYLASESARSRSASSSLWAICTASLASVSSFPSGDADSRCTGCLAARKGQYLPPVIGDCWIQS